MDAISPVFAGSNGAAPPEPAKSGRDSHSARTMWLNDLDQVDLGRQDLD